MSELIDRQALRAAHGLGADCHDCKRDMKSCQYDRDYSLMDFCEWIDDATTIDAVPVVRCGECKYWSEVDTSNGLRYGQCDYPHSAIRGNCFIRESWFCADGERKVQE